MGVENVETRKPIKYYRIFAGKLVRICDKTEPNAELFKATARDGVVTEEWAVPVTLTGYFSEVSYKKEVKKYNGADVVFRSVVVKVSKDGETAVIELPLESYGINFVQRCMTIEKQKTGHLMHTLKIFTIKEKKENGKEVFKKYAIPYQENNPDGIHTFYSETNPEPKEIKWVEGKDIDGKTTWNKTSWMKYYVGILEVLITPYFKKLDDERKKTEVPKEESHYDASMTPSDDEDIF